ncbi:hypothetical protein [Solibacillus sp. CAU 1738]|uniref:hypothetical protein n=1 Tax=Solibacillus sp. CAU 1738 TaxID=3140363 RepID=UPI0032609707
MRTSRVGATQSSIFRNSKQYLQTNEMFHRIMDEGGGQQFHQAPQQPFQPKKKQAQKKKSIVLKNSPHLIVKGMQYNANSAAIRNSLLQTSKIISYASKIKSRHHTYRTSI